VKAKQNIRHLYPEDFPVDDHEMLIDMNNETVSEGYTLSSILKSCGDSLAADWEDVKKSKPTILILLQREFLKEIRRMGFWIMISFRAALIGCMLGELRFFPPL
jgi:hypothetical protein